MGIEIIVADERGNKMASLEDSANILHRILPSHESSDFQCLNRIDWYGDTLFNRYQVPVVRAELERLKRTLTKSNELALIAQIEELAAECLAEPHLYLKFIGD